MDWNDSMGSGSRGTADACAWAWGDAVQGHQRALRGSERGVGDVDERNPHDVGERCTSTPHDQHESAQRGHAQQGTAQQVHTTLAWGAQACTTQTCTASACTAGTRNASMGDGSATTQACTAPAQSTSRRTPVMSTTLTGEGRTM